MIRARSGLLALACIVGAADAQTLPAAAEIDRAQSAVQQLGQKLRGALVAKMQAEGAVAAVAFCHAEAPQIAATVAGENGLSIGRTSLRVRSADNAPADWQQSVLADFATQVAAGAAPQMLQFSARVDSAEGPRLRYAQGIRAEGACLVCHGKAIAEPVRAAIAERYPGDRATGFAEGDLRGLFWVELALDPTAVDADPRAQIVMRRDQIEAMRAQMRHHLETLQQAMAALAADDWETVARAAEGGTGGGRGGVDFRSALPAPWFSIARPMHAAFADLRDEARGERRVQIAVQHLARATEFCTACHATYRVDAVAPAL